MLTAALTLLRNRKFLLYAVLPVVFIVSVWGSRCLGRRAGHKEERILCEQERTTALAQAEATYRQKESEHAAQINKLQQSYARKNLEADVVDAAASRDLGTGRERRRFPLARASCPKPAQVAAPSARTDGEATGELAPETARSLYSIAADGDKAIRQLTALQEWSREAVELCNGGKP